jgi:triacylglycerol lipase
MGISSLLSQPPIWREGRLAIEAASLARDPVFLGDGVSDGGGRPVLLIPGFLVGDPSLATMTRWLRRTGHHTRKAGIRLNVACSGLAVGKLEERLEELAEARGPVTIVGQSRGGTFAKALAVRRPELVSGIVTVGTPVVTPLAVHPLVRLQILALGALGTAGAPGLLRHSCLAGGCCSQFSEELAADVPDGVGYLVIYSRSDGIVDWRSCLDPAADEHVDVRASHVGMCLNPATYRAIAAALARFGARAPAACRVPAARAAA